MRPYVYNVNSFTLMHGHINGNGTFQHFYDDVFSLRFERLEVLEGDASDVYVKIVKSVDIQHSKIAFKILSLSEFKKQYVDTKTLICRGNYGAINFVLGLWENNEFISFSDNAVFKYSALDVQSKRDYCSTVKYFKIRFDFIPYYRGISLAA